MAKKSSSNAVKKIDKQIDALQKKRVKNEKEKVPVINKKEIEKKLIEEEIKKTIPKKKTTTKKNTSSNKKTSSTKNVNKTNTSKTTTKKNNVTNTKKKTTPKKVDAKKKEKIGEATANYKNLEKEIRSLYDRVNDITEDLDYTKTVEETNDILVTDVKIKKKDRHTRVDQAMDNISFSTLNKVILGLFAIFAVLFVAFVCFVIFISTY